MFPGRKFSWDPVLVIVIFTMEKYHAQNDIGKKVFCLSFVFCLIEWLGFLVFLFLCLFCFHFLFLLLLSLHYHGSSERSE